MVKKIAALVGAGAVLMSVAMPVLARRSRPQMTGSFDKAEVENEAEAEANTGGNILLGNVAYVDNGGDVSVSGSNLIDTGNATADAKAVVIANTHVGCCEEPNCGPDACIGGGGHRGRRGCECPHNDIAEVENEAEAEADTGENELSGNEAYVGGDAIPATGGHGGHHHRDEGDVTVGGNNTIRTGAAQSTARAWVVVNTHWDE